MTGIVDWAASRARMILAFIALSLIVGGYSYVALPKEGEPDIEVPATGGLAFRDAQYDLLAEHVASHVDIDAIIKLFSLHR